MTEKEVRDIINENFPIANDAVGGSLAQIQRAACKVFYEKIADKLTDETEMDKLRNQIKILEGIRDHFAIENKELKAEIANLKTAKVEAEHKYADLKYRSENTERVIENRTNAVIARANKLINENVPKDLQKELEDYRQLISSVRRSENLDLSQYSSRWRVLTRALVEKYQSTANFALFARSNGNFILARWCTIPALMDSARSENFDSTPFTHYMTIPKVSFALLVDGPSKEIDDKLCEGCPHHVTDENNPNKCALPECIKDHTISQSILMGKSTNNTDV